MTRYKKRGPYKPKELKFEHTCESCSKTFKSGDVRGRFCIECKQPRLCKCGCGKVVKTPGKLYSPGCKTRGKSYLEIYGTTKPNCGFKPGEGNLMKNEFYLEKALHNATKNRIQYDGISFRSTWEVEIYKDIKKVYPDVKYESSIQYPYGWFKPDFVIGNTIVEVSGFASAFEDTRERNINKLKKYLEYTDKSIIFIVSRRHIAHYLDVFKEEKRITLYEYEQKSAIHYPKG